MFSLYTTEKIVTAIYTDNEDKYQIWYDFISVLKPTIKILLDNNSDFYENEYNPAYLLVHTCDVEMSPLETITPECIDDPHSILLIDAKKEDAKSISSKYGCCCYSFNDIPANSFLFQESIEINVDKEDVKTNWGSLLFSEYVSPSNSLIFIDRYLFSDDSNGIKSEDGINNVFDVLNKILPPSLDKEYHVLLVFDASTLPKPHINDNSTENTRYTPFKRISTQINSLKKRLNRPYNIVIETVSVDCNCGYYNETHNRRILSNYFIIRAEHSLKAFRDSKSLYSQSLFLDWGASKGIVRSRKSDVPAKALNKCLKGIKDAINQLKGARESPFFSQNGNSNIPIHEIKNRLLNFSK